jgi:hypothetical protein
MRFLFDNQNLPDTYRNPEKICCIQAGSSLTWVLIVNK